MKCAIISIFTILAILCSFVLGGSAAHAAGSTIDIGLTTLNGDILHPSGSDSNMGDFTNVCLANMSQDPFTHTETLACKSNLGSNWWSPPDMNVGNGPPNTCVTYWTRITAYVNGSQVQNKNSNRFTICYNPLGLR